MLALGLTKLAVTWNFRNAQKVKNGRRNLVADVGSSFYEAKQTAAKN